jgi:hypothetical protein
MPKLLPLEKSVSKLRSYYQKNKRLPSFAEMGELLGYRSRARFPISSIICAKRKSFEKTKEENSSLLPICLAALKS